MFLICAPLCEKGIDSIPVLNIVVVHSLLINLIKKGRGMFRSITVAPKAVLKRAKYHPNLFSGGLAHGQIASFHKFSGNQCIICIPKPGGIPSVSVR
jgi:hypothetical protein